MLREEANMVKEYLKEGGYLTGELIEIIDDSIIDDDIKFDMHLLRGRYELKQLNGYSVLSVVDTINESNQKGSLLRFGKINEDGSEYINLSLSGDGNIYISDIF